MQQIQARNKPKFISEPPFQYLKLWWEYMRMTLSTNLSQFSQLYVGQTTCALQKNFCYSGNLSLLTFYQGTRSGTWVWLVAGATNETTGGWRQSLYHSCFCSNYSSKILYKSNASNKIAIKHAWLAKAEALSKTWEKRRSATSQLRRGLNKHLTTNITSNDVSWNASHLCFLESWWMTKGIQESRFQKTTITKHSFNVSSQAICKESLEELQTRSMQHHFFPTPPIVREAVSLVEAGSRVSSNQICLKVTIQKTKNHHHDMDSHPIKTYM